VDLSQIVLILLGSSAHHSYISLYITNYKMNWKA